VKLLAITKAYVVIKYHFSQEKPNIMDEHIAFTFWVLTALSD
jgi:hypothetical protein